MGQYLAWSIPRIERFKFVQMKSLGSKLPHPRGLNFYIVIYRERLKTFSSQKLLHQMGQYLAYSIPRTERFKFVQMKSLAEIINGSTPGA